MWRLKSIHDLGWTALVFLSLTVGVFVVALSIYVVFSLVLNLQNTPQLFDFGLSCDPSTPLLTLVYVIGTVGFQLIFGVLGAILIYFWSYKSKYRLMFAVTCVILPYGIPSSVSFTMFEILLSEDGIFGAVFSRNGSPLNGTWSRFATMTFLGGWQYFSMVTIVVLSSFLTIPSQMIQSARTDGARAFNIVTKIMLPVASPVIAMALVIRLILMMTKIDAPLAFHLTSSNDYACVAAVQIFQSIGLGSIPLGNVLILLLSTALVFVLAHYGTKGWRAS